MRIRGRTVSAALAACLALQQVPARATPPEAASGKAKLRVFAAASLRDAFTTLGEAFEAARPGVQVGFNFAGTQQLRTQLEHGAAVDVFASADLHHMRELVRAALVFEPVTFARNEPVVIVALEDTAVIRTFADLPAARRIVLGTPEVPIGRYTLEILDRASHALGAEFGSRVQAHVVSRELNARQVLAKVSLGEAQAGIVYRTDAAAAPGRVAVVPIPVDLNVIAEYPIAVVSEASHPDLAREWVAFVLSEDAQRTLQRAGFLPARADTDSP